MRKIFRFMAAAASLSMALSCSSFLDVDQSGKSDTDTYFADLTGLRTARNGLYRTVYDVYDDYLFKYAETAGDNLQMVTAGTGTDFYYQYNFLSTPSLESTAVGFYWKRAFQIIINANNILHYADGLRETYPSAEDEIDRCEAEAYFMRALGHFALVRTYAQPYSYTPDASHIGVPVVTKILSTKDRVGRSTVAEVYSQMIKDVEAAKAYFSDDKVSDPYYVSGAACDGLLAELYLYMGDYAKAEAYSALAMGVGLTPRDSYQAMFTLEQPGSEAILRLTGKSMNVNGSLYMFYDYTSPKYRPSSEFYAMFDDSDVRKNLLTGPDGRLACMKYYDLIHSSQKDRFYDITILRGSGMYLDHAEACCAQGKLSEAAADLRAVRARAYGADPSAPGLVVYYGKDDLMSQIKTERRKELCFEGTRFYDLARWGDDVVRPSDTNSSVKELTYPDYRFALPIPQTEIDVNQAMVQNDNY